MNPQTMDPVEAVLARLYRNTTAALVTPEVAIIVGRARRRRNARVVMAAVAAVLVVGLAVALTGPLRGTEGMPPVGPTPSEPTRQPTVGTRSDAALSLLPGFLVSPVLVEVGQSFVGVDPGDPAGWDTGGALTGCEGAPVDRLSVVRGVGEQGTPVLISLYLYADEPAARSAFAVIDVDPRACAGFPDAQILSASGASFGDESVWVTFAQPADGAGELTGMEHRVVAVRVGRVIEIIDASPHSSYPDSTSPTSWRKPAASQAALELVVASLFNRLCLYASTGCTPADGLPAALAALTRDGAAWLVMVPDTGAVGDQGQVVAALAELGYHPSIVTSGCDVSPELQPGPSRYVALYFARREDAQAVSARLAVRSDSLLVGRAVMQVRTGCVD